MQYTPDEKWITVFNQNVLQDPTWDTLERGTITLERGREILLARHPEEEDLTSFYFANWFGIFESIEGTIDLLYQLKRQGYRVYLVANLIREVHASLSKKFPFFQQFDGHVLSYEVNSIKPEIQIYEHLFERYHLVPGECAFIDRAESSVIKARTLGALRIHFISPAILRVDLHKSGML